MKLRFEKPSGTLEHWRPDDSRKHCEMKQVCSTLRSHSPTTDWLALINHSTVIRTLSWWKPPLPSRNTLFLHSIIGVTPNYCRAFFSPFWNFNKSPQHLAPLGMSEVIHVWDPQLPIFWTRPLEQLSALQSGLVPLWVNRTKECESAAGTLKPLPQSNGEAPWSN